MDGSEGSKVGKWVVGLRVRPCSTGRGVARLCACSEMTKQPGGKLSHRNREGGFLCLRLKPWGVSWQEAPPTTH